VEIGSEITDIPAEFSVNYAFSVRKGFTICGFVHEFTCTPMNDTNNPFFDISRSPIEGSKVPFRFRNAGFHRVRF
jgi:hypothetical protein